MPADDVKLALLEQRIEYLVDGFDAFTKRFDEWQKGMVNEFVPRGEFELTVQSLRSEFSSLREEVKGIKEDKKSTRSFVISCFSVGIAAAMTIIDLIALNHK